MTRCATPVVLLASLALLATPRAARAQSEIRDASGGYGMGATRDTLEGLARRLEAVARAAAENKATRAEAARAAARVRARLSAGDFTVGDRVALVVEGEKELSDTFVVGPGRRLALPGIADVPLDGVLRGELPDYLTRRLARNLRDPFVRAQAFVRVSVQGAVVRPGYYWVPAESQLSDALMHAGGMTPEADIKRVRIERNGEPLWEGRIVEQAIAAGRTLDETGLMAGDQFFVPRRTGASAGNVLRFTAFLLTIPVTIYSLTRIF